MPKRKGPLPRFASIHVQMALDLIARQNRVGRKDISEKLGVGEGSVRTILNELKKNGLITSSRGGHSLTPKGKRALGQPPEFVQVKMGDLAVGKVNVATIVRGAASKVKRGIEQRDEAIKAGADGATVLFFKEGRFSFPDRFLEVPKATSEILIKALQPKEGDVVVIGTATDALRAEVGARAAALSLIASG